MDRIADGKAVIHKISQLLDTYDKIILFDTGNEYIKALLYDFLEKLEEYSTKKHVIVLSRKQQPCCVYPYYLGIGDAEYEVLVQLYFMYEFSDKITLISKQEQYAGILNYMETGILSAEQVFEALLK